MANISFEEREELREVKERLNADAKANWGDSEWQRETAAEITRLINVGFQNENLLDLLANVQTADDGDTISVEELSGVDVHWVAPGGRIEESVWDDRDFELTPDRVAFHLSALVEKIRSNFFRQQQTIVDGGIASLNAAINARVLALYRAGTQGGNSASTSSVAIADVNNAVTVVRDASLADNVTIVGRGTMVDQIFDLLVGQNNFAPATQDTLIRNGYMGTYRGANLVKLKNYTDSTKTSYFRANEMYVVGADAAEVGLWGNLATDTWQDPGVNNARWHFEGLRKAGFALTNSDRVFRITDTSLAP